MLNDDIAPVEFKPKVKNEPTIIEDNQPENDVANDKEFEQLKYIDIDAIPDDNDV